MLPVVYLFVFIMNTTLGNGTESTFASSYVGYALTSVTIFGSLGNILVISSICKQNFYKNTHYYVVLHLSICDLISLLLAASRSYEWLTGEYWTVSTALCKLTILPRIFCTAGILFMVVMSLLRYRAVCYPLRPAVNRWKLHLASATVYVFGLLFRIPLLFIFGPDQCSEPWPSSMWNTIYAVTFVAFQFFIPVVILGVVYWKICSELFKQGKIIKSMNTSIADEEKERWLFQILTHHRNRRAFLISFIIFICFLVAGSPWHIAFTLYVIDVLDIKGCTYMGWLDVMYFFGVSAVNPFIYGALDKKLSSIFKRCKRKNGIGVH